MKIVIDKAIPFISGLLEPFAEVSYIAGSEICADHVKDADAMIVRTRTRCDEALLSGSRVRFIATATIGFDHIDTAYCASNGIEVSTSAGCNARAVLQWVSAALAAFADRDGWQPDGMTIGVVGVGNVGSLVADYCTRWGFDVLRCDPPRARRGESGFVPLERIAAQADIVTFHTPLNRSGIDRTLSLADADLFGRLRQGAVLLNSSRGEVVDEAALKQAIRTKGIKAAIDTWCGEPSIDPELLGAVDFASQHISGYSVEGKARATAMAVDALASRFDLPLKGWYPPGIARSTPREISWQRMRSSIRGYLDIEAHTAALRSRPQDFEAMRSAYDYRREFF